MTPLPRRPHHIRILNALIDSRRGAPFEWGANDCCLFGCDAVLDMTGHDFAADFRGKYDSALGAERLLHQHGARDVSELAAKFARDGLIEPVAVQFANRGDFLVYSHGTLHALGICVGEYGAFVTIADGLTFLPRMACSAAYTY